jgi:hypothetical protein
MAGESVRKAVFPALSKNPFSLKEFLIYHEKINK